MKPFMYLSGPRFTFLAKVCVHHFNGRLHCNLLKRHVPAGAGTGVVRAHTCCSLSNDACNG